MFDHGITTNINMQRMLELAAITGIKYKHFFPINRGRASVYYITSELIKQWAIKVASLDE